MAIKVDALGAFALVSNEAQETLLRAIQERQFPLSATLIRKGQQVSGAYVVMSGRLRVFTHAPDGTEATLYFISPGETCVLALNCLFNDLLYPAWVRTDAATTVAVIPGATYRALFQREPAIQDLTVRALSTLVFRLMDELEHIHSCHLDQRLAHFLLHHAASNGELAMTQQEIASHLGTTREVIARLLRPMVTSGGVETGRRCIRILNAERLHARTP